MIKEQYQKTEAPLNTQVIAQKECLIIGCKSNESNPYMLQIGRRFLVFQNLSELAFENTLERCMLFLYHTVI